MKKYVNLDNKEKKFLNSFENFLKKTKKDVKSITRSKNNQFYLIVLAGAYSCSVDANSTKATNLDSITGNITVDLLDNNQVVTSSGGESLIVTGAGDDSISSGDAADRIFSSDGEDIIRGGKDSDTITGEGGADTLLIVGRTAQNEYAVEEIEGVLDSVLTLTSLNNNIEDESSSDIIDGGAGYDSVVLYGNVDLSDVTFSNIQSLRLHSNITISENTFTDDNLRIIQGDGSSILVLKSNKDSAVNLSDFLSGVTDVSGIARLEIPVGVNIVVDSQVGADLLLQFSVIGGGGALRLVDNINLSDNILFEQGFNLIGQTRDFVREVVYLDEAADGNSIIGNTLAINLDLSAYILSNGGGDFEINSDNQLVVTANLDYEDINRYSLEFVHNATNESVRVIVLVNNIVERFTQLQINTLSRDVAEGETITFNREFFSSIVEDPNFIFLNISSDNASITKTQEQGEFVGTYLADTFNGIDVVTVTFRDVITGENRDYFLSLNVTATNDLGVVTIEGSNVVGSTLIANLIDSDGVIGDVSYLWSSNGVQILGATNQTYVVGSDYAGTDVTVLASYTNQLFGRQEATSVELRILGNSPIINFTGNLDIEFGTTATGTFNLLNPEDSIADGTEFFGQFGTVTINFTEPNSYTWTYEFNDNIEALPEGEEVTENFQIQITGDNEDRMNQALDFPLNFTIIGGANPTEFTGMTSLTVEDTSDSDVGNLSDLQSITVTDIDGDVSIVSATLIASSGVTGEGVTISEFAVLRNYGFLRVLENGTYFFENGLGVDTLNEGESINLNFDVQVSNDESGVITVRINGDNDSPGLNLDSLDINGLENGSTTVNLGGISSLDSAATISIGDSTNLDNSLFTINDNGELVFTSENPISFDEQDSYSVEIQTNLNGVISTEIITIDVNNQEIATEFQTFFTDVYENIQNLVVGRIVDPNQIEFSNVEITGNNENLVQVNNNGQIVLSQVPEFSDVIGANNIINFDVSFTDDRGGSFEESLTFNIVNNNTATITGDFEFDLRASSEPITRTLTVLDSDTDQDVFKTDLLFPASYGNFIISSTGTWTYSLEQNFLPETIPSMGLIDVIVVQSFDGTATQELTFTIIGTPIVTGVPSSVNVMEGIASNVDLSGVILMDEDEVTVTLTATSGTFSGVMGTGVTVSGGDTGTLNLVGSTTDINTYLDTIENIQYTSDSIDGSFTININDGVNDVNLGVININFTPTIDGAVPTDITVTEDMASPVDLSSVEFSDIDGDNLTVSLTVSAGIFIGVTGMSGVVVAGAGEVLTLTGSASDINRYLDTTSNIQYTPVNNVNGEDAVTFTIVSNDGTVESQISTVNLDITAENDAPVALDTQTATISEDSLLTVSPNASDVDLDILTLTVDNVSNGTATVDVNGDIVFTPTADFNGEAIISYTASDDSVSDTGIITVTVTAENDAGVLEITGGSGAPDTELSFILTDVDGINGQEITVSLLDNNGEVIGTPVMVLGVEDIATGTILVPTDVVEGEPISLRAGYEDDGATVYNGGVDGGNPFISSEAITVSSNEAPTAVNDIGSIDEDAVTPVLIDVLANDSDQEGQTLTVTQVTGDDNGTAMIVGNQISYIANADFSGIETLTYTLSDSVGATNIAEVSITVNGINDTPVALDTQTATISEDSLLTVSPNASDVDLDILTLTVDNVSNGTATVDVNGDIVFTPTADFNGEAIISYTASDDSISDTGIITVTVTAENDAPVALDTQTATISEDSLLTVSPNASDVDLDILTLTVDNVSNGTATVDVNGDIVFTPTADFNGEAIISYTASDDSVSDTGIITVTVTAENDAGVLEITGGSGAPDTELSFSLTDLDGIGGQEITVSLLDNNGEVIGAPVMVLGVEDIATGTILVPTDVVEGEPISLRAGYEDDGATVYNDGVDGGNSFISSEAITVSANEAPTAVNDIGSIDEDALSPVLIDVLANDSDQEGQTLTVTQVTGDDNGTAMIVGNQISYIANADFSGIETLTYTLSDSVGATNIAEVSITVNAINDAPVALDTQTATISEDSLLTVSPNASDVDLDILTLTVDNVSNGTATVDVNGDIVFTPTVDFNGEAIISYTASDDSVSDTGIITVTVTAENDAPVALDNQTATISEDSLLTVSPNASDVDLDILTLTVDNVSNGTATVDVNGDIVFTPTADFNGEAIISYTASDDSISDTGIITVTVTAENDAGVLEITGGSGAPDTELSFSLTDVDGIDGQEITVSLLDNNGEVIGTPVMVLGVEDIATGTILVPTDVVEGEPISLRAGYEDDGATVYNGGVDGGNPFISSEAITVSANEAPTAVNDIGSIDEDALSPVLIDVLSNDSDQEGQTLTVTQVTGDDNGTAMIVGNQISYIANADFSGIETLTYTLSDSVGATNIAEVSITVNGINDAPVALDTQTATISEDSLLTVSPNASDVDLDILSITVDNVSNGTATVDVNGDIVFTPTVDFNGEAIISYTASDDSVSDTGIITVTVTAENDAPVALDTQTATISEDSLLTVSPNASDVDLDILTLTVDNVSNGTATVDVNGDIVFTPTADFNGEAIISYTASDDSISDTGIITVTVTAENDAGVLEITGGSGAPDTELSFSLTDVDGIGGQEITVSLLDNNGEVIGTPVMVLGVEDIAIGTILVPTDVVEGEPISLRAGYEDDGATVYNGGVDGGNPFISSEAITVSANEAPTAVNDIGSIDEDAVTPVLIDVLSNDSDQEGQTLTVTQVTGDDNGTAMIVGNQISYIANADFSGIETLTYTLSDSVGATNIAEVSITVNGINDAPVALDTQTATISEDSLLTVSPNASDVDLDILTLTVDNVSNGTATVDVNGDIVFTPTADFNGEAIISYTASDDSVSDTGIITVTVTAENDAPVALDTQTATISEDSLLTVSPNASDVDLDILTLTVDNVSNGTATVDVNGDIVFTPTADFNGEAIISYTASDDSVSDTGIITVTVTEENDAGVLEITGGSGAPDTELSFSLTDVDGIDGQEITVSLLDNNGEVIGTPVMVLGVEDIATGTILVPTDVVEGEPISLRAGYEDDGATVYNGGVDGGNPFISSEAITVSANEAPTAVNDIGSIDEDAVTPVLIDVLSNDSDQEGQTLTVTQVTGDDNGTAMIVGNQISYIANADFSGIETLTYTLSDSVGATNIAEVSITVNGINDAPVALDTQTATISEDSLLTVSPNASDVDLDILTLTVDNVSNGTATVDVNGDIVFTPTADFNGEAIISYTASDDSVSDTGIITVTVTAENDAPVALDNQTATISEDSLLTVSPNASDVDLDILTLTVDNVSNGTATVDVNGDIVFTPTADFNGEAIISYTASDDSVSDTGIITVTVTAENDVGVLEITGGSGAPDTELSFILTDVDGIEGQEITVSLLDNNGEVIGTPVMVLGVEDIATGTILVPTDVVEGEPISLRAGYEDDGATVYNGGVDGGNPFISSEAITVSANEAPTAVNDIGSIDEDAVTPVLIDVLSNDSDQEGQTLTVTQVTGDDNGTAMIVGNQISYIANADFSGIETLTYTLSDSVGATNIAEVSITVNGINDAPVALDTQTATISEDSLLTVSPNASDVDLDILSITVDNVSNGTATVDVNGDIVFTPTVDFNGEAIISYTASDDSVSDTGIITVTVTAENDAPVALDTQTATISEDSLLTVSPNASDVDLDILTLTVDNVSNGTATVDVNGDIVFTPTADFNGEAIISYTASDDSISDTGIITVTVTAENDAGVLEITGGSGAPDTELSFSLTDVDGIDGQEITVSLLDNNGEVIGTPVMVLGVEDIATGTILVPTDVVEGEPISLRAGYEDDGATVYNGGVDGGNPFISSEAITVSANEAPTAVNDIGSIDEDALSPVLIDVLSNDSDQEGQTLTVTQVTGDDNGTAMIVGNQISYIANADFSGIETLTYTLSDSVGATNIAEVSITVNGINDAPVALDTQTATISEDSLLTVSPNASDVDLDILSITVDNVSNGTATVDVNGDIVFTPTVDFNGEAIISYTASDDSVSDTGIITVTVTAENDAPVALDTQTATISEDSLLTVSPNASDVDLDILTLTVDNVSNGTATVDVNGDIVFTPTADFNGEAIISYTASDDSISDTGIITVTVTAENDAGVLEITGGSGAPDTELSFSLTDVDGIGGQEITVSLLDNNGEVIGTPVMVLGVEDIAIGTILVPTDVVEGEPISLRAGYEDDGATVYNGGVDGGNPFISSEAITVSANEAPTAVNDIGSIDEDAVTPVLIDVLSNDSDQEGQTLTVTQVTGDDNGTAMIVGNQISYIANADFSGIETLTYTLSDSVGATNIAEVSITVNGINDAPVALDTQTATISEDSLLTVSPNASDVDLDILTLTVDNVSNGTATVDVNGDIVFTPTADFNGEAIISYTASDDSVSDTGIITVTVTAENDAPVALDTQTATISEDSLLTVSPNASDVDLDILTLTVDNVSNGTATVDVNGDIVFTPTADFNGEAIISYTASDDSVSDTGIITVTVTEENDAGVLEITGGSGAPDTELSFSLTDVDGIDGQEITVSLLDNNGEVIGTPVMVLGVEDIATGTILVPTDVVEGEPISLRAGYEDDGATVYNGGVDGGNPFISSEAITVSANEAPTAVNDIGSIDEDAVTPVLIDVLANDSDQEGQTLTVTQVTGDDNGTAMIVGNQISYIANADFSGIETLTYTLSDSVGATNIAEVSITVNGINDAPVALDTQTATISEDSLLTVSPNASDVDLDILTLTVDNVSNGTATVDVNGDIVFTPTADFNGEAIISYTASDDSVSDTGIITVTVTAENDAPVALDNQTATISEDSLLTVSPNASDVDLDILTLTVDNVSNGTATVDVNGDIVFTPTADFNGEAIISYTASDDSVSDTGIITVTVTAENDAGVLEITGGSGAPDTELSFILTDVDGIEGQEITVSLLDNNGEVIGTPVMVLGVEDIATGTILVPTDVVEGEPISLRAGYEDDGATVYNGGVDGGNPFISSEAITVSANEAPTAVNDIGSIDEDAVTPVLIDVLANDSDQEGQTLTVTQVTGDDNGTAMIVGNQISYIANADFSGIETLTYTLSDSVGATNIAEVSITVNGINDAPVALDTQTATISEDSLLTVSPNASDVDLDILTLTVDNVSNGTATVDVNGDIVFTPTADFNGEAIISYTASDDSVSDTGIITVTVTAENDAPVALDTQTATISEDSLLTVSPNASDVDLDILTLTVDNVSNGTATVDVNGDIVFTPTADFNGEAIISYTASDDSVSDTGIITVTVTAENDAGVLEITGGSGAPDTELSFSLTDLDGIEGQEITVSLLDNNGEVIGTPVMVLGVEDIATGTILVPTDVVEGEPISLRAGYEDDGATVYNGGVDGGNPFISSEAITVSANEAPTAVNDIGSIDEDAVTPVLIDVLSNDSDQEGQTLTVTQVTGDDNGTAMIVGNQISYIANADFSGIETLTYTLSDSVGATNIAEVSITVNGINDTPVALDTQTATISEDSLLTVSPNASDVDLDILTLTVDNVSNGTATVDVNGDIVFTPTVDFNGEAIISYTASDDSVSDTGIITVTVTAENDAPVALDTQTATISEDSLLTVSPNASDVDLDILTLTVDNVSNGTATVDVNGDIVFTPTADFNGEAIISYTASDDSVSDTGIITVTVTAENDAGVLEITGGSGAPDTELSFSLTDVDGIEWSRNNSLTFR